MTIEQAIKNAIKGRWKGEGATFNAYEATFRDIHWYFKGGYADNCSLEEALLDPPLLAELREGDGVGYKAKRVAV